MMPKTIRRLLVLFLSLNACGCLGFAPRSSQSLSSPIQKPFSDCILDDRLSSTLAMVPSADIEAEALTTMAHVTMDFTGFFSPSKTLLRLFAVLGRIFVISADYITDHSIHPEELVIQLFLMGIAVRELIVDNPNAVNTTATNHRQNLAK